MATRSRRKRRPQGWMKKSERRWLAEQAARHSPVVEVGVWRGRTTQVLARATEAEVFAVDHWRGVPDDPDQQGRLYPNADDTGDAVYQQFRKNLRRFIKKGRVIPVRADSVTAADYLLGRYGVVFGMVFLDADHRYESVCRDIEAYRRLLRPGGLFCGHDFPNYPGVERAVTEAFGDRLEIGPGRIWSVPPEEVSRG